MKRVLLLMALGAVMMAGCSGAAKIHRRSGNAVEGRITRSTAGRIYFKADGNEIFIKRSDVETIDHPGKALAGVGTAVLVAGVALAAGGYAGSMDRTPSDRMMSGIVERDAPAALFLFLGSIVAASGAGIGILGWAVWGQSRFRASSPLADSTCAASSSIRLVGMSPLVSPERKLAGAALGFEFQAVP